MARISFIFMVAFASFAQGKDSVPFLAHFSGQGWLSQAPEYASVTVTVRSECSPTPAEAQSATDSIVEKIDSYFQGLKRDGDEHFEILVDGGYTAPFSRWHKEQEICKNSFQKTSTITLKIGLSSDFDKTFSELQSFVLKHFSEGPWLGVAEHLRSFVTLEMPRAAITRKSRLELERKAYDLALRDAIGNFKSAIQSCESKRWQIYAIGQSDENSPRYSPSPHRYMAKAGASAEMAEAIVAPVKFDKIEVSRDLSVTFQFADSLCAGS